MVNKIGYRAIWNDAGEVTAIIIDPDQRGFGQITNLPLAKEVTIEAPDNTYFKKINIHSKEDWEGEEEENDTSKTII